jgi:hypothetical protein
VGFISLVGKVLVSGCRMQEMHDCSYVHKLCSNMVTVNTYIPWSSVILSIKRAGRRANVKSSKRRPAYINTKENFIQSTNCMYTKNRVPNWVPIE